MHNTQYTKHDKHEQSKGMLHAPCRAQWVMSGSQYATCPNEVCGEWKDEWVPPVADIKQRTYRDTHVEMR